MSVLVGCRGARTDDEREIERRERERDSREMRRSEVQQRATHGRGASKV